MIYGRSPSYLRLAYESLEKADRLLALGRMFMWLVIGVSVITLLGTVLYIIIRKCRKNK